MTGSFLLLGSPVCRLCAVFRRSKAQHAPQRPGQGLRDHLSIASPVACVARLLCCLFTLEGTYVLIICCIDSSTPVYRVEAKSAKYTKVQCVASTLTTIMI